MDSELSFRRGRGGSILGVLLFCLPVSKSLHGASTACTTHSGSSGVGIPHGELSPLLWSAWLTSLRDHGVVVLSLHRDLLDGGGTTTALCIKSGPAG